MQQSPWPSGRIQRAHLLWRWCALTLVAACCWCTWAAQQRRRPLRGAPCPQKKDAVVKRTHVFRLAKPAHAHLRLLLLNAG